MPPNPSPDTAALEQSRKHREVFARALHDTTGELETRIQELGLLRELGQLLERSPRLEELAAVALPMLLRLAAAENASILLHSPATGELNLLAAAGRSSGPPAYYGPGSYALRMFGPDEGVAGACFALGETLFVGQTEVEPRFLEKPGTIRVGALACIPLVAHEQALGVLNLSHPQANALEAARLPACQMLASFLAIAISHAQLQAELKHSRRRLEDRIQARTQKLQETNRALQQTKAQVTQHSAELEETVRERTTELERTLSELQAQHAHLLEAHRVKDEFLNNINHELKTPLNAIIGYAGLLLQDSPEQLSEQQRADLRLIEGNGKHLLQILENIFILKDVARDAVEVEKASTDLNELIASVVASVRPQAEVKHLETVFEPLDVPPLAIDPKLVRMIVFNLLDNAIKFSRRGKISVRTGVSTRDPSSPQQERSPDQGGRPFAVVEVEDQGRGIQPGEIERIFERFYQGEPAMVKSEGGSGVGLAIVKNLVELHGGRIWVTSRPGAGSTFGFVLPLGE